MLEHAPVNEAPDQKYPNSARLRAFSVHILTACGAALALLAMLAAVRGAWVVMFCWLAVALVVDAIDGALARRFKVTELAPRWSGRSEERRVGKQGRAR